MYELLFCPIHGLFSPQNLTWLAPAAAAILTGLRNFARRLF